MPILDDLNSEQRKAAEHLDGPLLIFAGAGSGKTRALTYRIAYLIRGRDVPPENILAVTFTNKAANEMKERIHELIGEDARRVWAGTFHSIAARMLRRHGEAIGIRSDYTIFDVPDQQAVIKECLSILDLDSKQWSPPSVLATISNAKNELVTPRAFARAAKRPGHKVIASIYKLYQERLAENNALDFDDLIMGAVELMETVPEVADQYQTRFRHVLVDEYQDINHAQYRLVKAVSAKHGNLAVVGDDDQSIYGWRGANVGIILDFEKDYPDAKVVVLEQNYRSTQKILECAFDVIKHNKTRAPKKLWTNNPVGDNIVCYQAVNEQEEATFIAATIRELAEQRGRRWSDFAVLYRTNAQSRVVEESFLTLGLPYRIVGGLRFYERREIKDLMAYLKVLFNPRDGVSLRRIINVPARGIGDRTIAALDRFAHAHDLSLFEAVTAVSEADELSPLAVERVSAFANIMLSLMEQAERLDLTAITNAVLDDTGYLSALLDQGTAESASRAENLREFLSVTKRFEKTREDASLGAFIEHISLLADVDDLEDQGNAVALMTLHAAKGLEFPIVFIAGLEEGLLPHQRALADGGLDEERRLCYVGITRAQERLYLTHAYRRTIFGQTATSTPSCFLKDLPKEFVDRRDDITRLKASAPPPDDGDEAGMAGRRPGGPKLNLVKVLNRQEGVRGKPKRAKSKGKTWRAPKAAGEQVTSEALFVAGDKVKHAKFGKGVVVSCKESAGKVVVTVAFPKTGVKKLALEYAGLEKA